MPTSAALILLCAAAFGVIDWTAVIAEKPAIEAFAKPGVMVLLIAAVIVGGSAGIRWVVAAGLLASLVGDIALLERFDRFVLGLSWFLVAHLLYIATFLLTPSDPSPWQYAASFTLLVVLASGGMRIIRAASREDERLRIPVSMYVLVLSVMLIAGSFGALLATTGASAFALSDAVLGWNRFVQPLRWGRVATHILYHAGQWLLAVWAIGL